MSYQFFDYPDIDACVGIAVDGPRVAFHVPCAAGDGKGNVRNSQRRDLFLKLASELERVHQDSEAIAARYGRLDTPMRPIRKRLGDEGASELREAFIAGRSFRFDFWLDLGLESSPSLMAEQLGLVPIEHSPMKVMWPETDLGPTADEDEEKVSKFNDRLDELIVAVADPSSTSANKWVPLENFVAGAVGLTVDDVVVGYASERKHILNRIRQRGGRATLRLILSPDAETTKHARKIMEDMAQGRRKTDALALALVTRTSEGWRVVNLWPLKTPTPDVALMLARATGVPLPEASNDEEALAASLFVSVDWLRDVLWLLDDKKGIVFYGPPGTGKTYIASKIAEFIQQEASRRTIVQLHPSFGYEEFFEGYRPVAGKDGEAPRLEKRDGPLKTLVGMLDGEDVGVLVLDEMNRGNLPRVFGELYFLLEYRDRPVRLMYSEEGDEPFKLPDGLRIIGTMNTADRSVALLDQALRRRFHFIGLFPREAPVDGVLRRYLREQYGDAMDWVADVLDAANTRLDRNVAIGPSHFMRPDLDAETVQRIWRHSVLPTIEEHYFGQPERVAEFSLDALRASTRKPPTIDEATPIHPAP